MIKVNKTFIDDAMILQKLTTMNLEFKSRIRKISALFYRSGLACHIFTCNTSMMNSAFQSSDGEMLIVAQGMNKNGLA